jgi:cell division protein FtsI (penicillin-binding protein 3)
MLAGSKQVPSCYADPFLISDEDLTSTASAVGEALRCESDEVLGMLLERRRKRFAWLKRGITQDEVDAIKALNLRSVGITYEWRRYYPNAGLAAATIGFLRVDGEPGAGLEISLREHLAPQDGRCVVVTDHRGRAISAIPGGNRSARNGRHVYLCLDDYIQRLLEKAVSDAVRRFGVPGRTWGAGVVVEPHSGRVLAISSTPSFDPNRYSDSKPQAYTNRVVSMPFEPGSAAKPIFAAGAVEAGVLNYDSRLFCENGLFRIRRGGRIRDHGQSYGQLSLEDIVVFSSNIGMAKVGLSLGNARLHAIAKRAGFGRKTGMETPGEDAGIVRDLRKWNTYSTPRVPFGQEVSVTLIQLAMAFCSLVNGGELLRPRLVDYVCDDAGDVVWRSRREVIRRFISPSTSARTLKVLEQVVRRGTGKSCRLSRWTSFGKTGTGQIPGPEGYIDDAYTGSFLGGAPVDRPRVLCLITVYWPDASKGYYGSKVAAPYVKEVLERTLTYLDVPSDLGFCSARRRRAGIRR